MFPAKEPWEDFCSHSTSPCRQCPSKQKPTPRVSSWKMGRSVHKSFVVITWHLFKNNIHACLIPGIRPRQLQGSTPCLREPAGSQPRHTTDNLLLLHTHHCQLGSLCYRELFPLYIRTKKCIQPDGGFFCTFLLTGID